MHTHKAEEVQLSGPSLIWSKHIKGRSRLSLDTYFLNTLLLVSSVSEQGGPFYLVLGCSPNTVPLEQIVLKQSNITLLKILYHKKIITLLISNRTAVFSHVWVWILCYFKRPTWSRIGVLQSSTYFSKMFRGSEYLVWLNLRKWLYRKL